MIWYTREYYVPIKKWKAFFKVPRRHHWRSLIREHERASSIKCSYREIEKVVHQVSLKRIELFYALIVTTRRNLWDDRPWNRRNSITCSLITFAQTCLSTRPLMLNNRSTINMYGSNLSSRISLIFNSLFQFLCFLQKFSYLLYNMYKSFLKKVKIRQVYKIIFTPLCDKYKFRKKIKIETNTCIYLAFFFTTK